MTPFFLASCMPWLIRLCKSVTSFSAWSKAALICSSATKNDKKYWTHHERKNVYDVSNFFIYDCGRNDFYKASKKPCKSQKALHIKNYLLASSIATATATCHYGMTGEVAFTFKVLLISKLPQSLQLLLPSFLPWGCYLLG